MVFQTSCANVGMPTGGDKDTIPPEVVRIDPLPNQTDFNKQIVTMTFDEFVVSTDVPSKMLVSPPLKKNPSVRMRSKTIMIDFKEQLKANQSYSIDFRNSIKDNNEGNPMEDFRMAFSTGDELDTLMVGGYVRLAENMEPMEDALISLYAIDSLHYFRDSIPDYVGKSDADGFFMISNIKPGKYRMYALQDLDNSLTYNSTEEQIAFIDTLITPIAMEESHSKPDSLLSDSILNVLPDSIAEAITEKEFAHQHEHHQDLPEPYYLRLYTEDEFNQYLNSEERERKNLCSFYFDESLSDSSQIKLIKPAVINDEKWNLLEYSLNRDSLFVWITDTSIANIDTLGFALTYTVIDDSLKTPVMQTDTINLVYQDKDAGKKRKKIKKDDEDNEEIQVPHFSFNSDASKDFDIYRDLTVVSAEPVKSIDYSMIHLCRMENDSVEIPIDFQFIADSLNLCKYYVKYPWKYEESYHFYIDSAAAVSISEMPSNSLDQDLTIRAEDYYAKITLDASNVNSPTIFQLIKSGKEEQIVASKSISKDGEIVFPLLDPDKLTIKAILDTNNNGKWDVGDIDKGLQPERIVYYPKILKLRSNFEVLEDWVLPDDMNKQKDLIDEDAEEKAKFGGPKDK